MWSRYALFAVLGLGTTSAIWTVLHKTSISVLTFARDFRLLFRKQTGLWYGKRDEPPFYRAKVTAALIYLGPPSATCNQMGVSTDATPYYQTGPQNYGGTMHHQLKMTVQFEQTHKLHEFFGSGSTHRSTTGIKGTELHPDQFREFVMQE